MGLCRQGRSLRKCILSVRGHDIDCMEAAALGGPSHVPRISISLSIERQPTEDIPSTRVPAAAAAAASRVFRNCRANRLLPARQRLQGR